MLLSVDRFIESANVLSFPEFSRTLPEFSSFRGRLLRGAIFAELDYRNKTAVFGSHLWYTYNVHIQPPITCNYVYMRMFINGPACM